MPTIALPPAPPSPDVVPPSHVLVDPVPPLLAAPAADRPSGARLRLVNDPPVPQLIHSNRVRICAYCANCSMEGPMINRLRDPFTLIVALAFVVLAGEIAVVQWLS